MKPQIIKSKDKNRILERMTKLAESYTPDWNPDFNDPDFGSALALIFKDMYLEQAERLNRMPDKQRRDIVNLFSPIPHGPEASRGYVTFELSEGASSGVFLNSGFQLLSEGPGDTPESTEIHFETVEPLYVTHSKIKKVIVYDHEKGWFSTHETNDSGCHFPLFKVEAENNENKPYIQFFDPKWLYARAGMKLGISFIAAHELDQNRLLEGLNSADKASWYTTVDGEAEILPIHLENDCIWIEMNEQMKLSGTLNCALLDIPYFRNIEINDIQLQLRVDGLIPEKILYNETLIEPKLDLHKEPLKPFGDQYNVFDVFLLGDSDLFSKAGAELSIDIKVKEQLIPISTDSEEQLVKWRNVMHESELREPESKTVRIETLVWEYWNGVGWTPLSVNHEAYKLPSEGLWTITFICPNDITPAVFGPVESLYIRARVAKVQNAFAPKGNTAVPLITGLQVHANTLTSKKIVRPSRFDQSANLETYSVYEKDIKNGKIQIAKAADDDIVKAVYFSLSDAVDKGPIRIEIEPKFQVSDVEPVSYKVQYFGLKGGRENWHDLPHEDETNGFMINGLISFMAPKHMTKTMRFGSQSYWLRILPMNGAKSFFITKNYGRNLNIRLNSVMVRQKETLTAEYYAVPTIQPWASITLSRSPVLEAEVWMNELGIINEEELTRVQELSPETVQLEHDKRGELTGIWRKWKEVRDFKENVYEGRIYKLDLERGRIMFGDGKTGRIPHSDLAEYIRVEYALGGGFTGNVETGKIAKAVSSIPFLERVYNGGPIWGGLGTETTSRAEKRVREHVRHRGLSLSTRDITHIIFAQNRDIHDVKVTGSKGNIRISILPDAYPYQVSHFFEIKEKTKEIINDSISLNLSSQDRFEIIEPIKIAFSVNMDVVVDSAGDYIKALSRWNEQLEHYFDPLRGGSKNKGWQIGQLPEHSSVISDLKHMLEGTEQIDNVMIQMHYINGESREAIHHGSSLDLQHAIPVNGEHDIRISIVNM